MSSPQQDTPEMKGGHAPAVKVGGMRVKAPRVHAEEKPAKEDQTNPWETEGAVAQDQTDVIVSGVKTHGNKDFTPQAVKVAHEKPTASITKPAPPQQNRIIQQPR